MFVAGGVLILALAMSPVQVVDDGCPSGARVEEAVASMLAAPSESTLARRDVARLEHRGDDLHIQLVDPEGAVVAERTIAGRGSCAELARIAAIVVASWESDVHPEFVRKPAEIPVLERAPGPALERSPPAAPPPSPASYDVAGGVTFGQSDTLAAGASLGAAWFPRGNGMGLWASGAGDLTRTIAVGTHEARWRRWTGSLEAARRWTRRALTLDPHAGLMLGWMETQGVDYAQNRTASTLALGGTAGIRAGQWFSRRAALWLELRGFFFPRPDTIYGLSGDTAAEQRTVPRWGAVASVGLALGRAPLSP